MRLTLSLLGLELDVTLGPADAPSPAPDMDPLRDLGATGGTFVGFASHVAPEDIPLPQRTPAWDDEDRRR